eukprot:GFUD01019336.1.p1 GENE.GFUD01019336.1~~GFUD01019336.1.p1  ORF type:complete len:114 (-),score=25.62 GFUD01019336.1:83-424(-)
MSIREKNNNVYFSSKPKKTKNAERPRPSEYNLPLVLTDATRDPPRTFQRDNLLGTGGFAKVFQVTDASTGVNYADKVISNKAMFARRNSAKHKVEREISLHRKMKHENIVTFH